MLIIGICGASGSGKTTLAQDLQSKITGSVVLLNQDAYYRDHPHLSFEERAKINYDEPGIFEHDVFLTDVQRLLAGKPITRKTYDYALHRRSDPGTTINPADVLLLEGIHVFYDNRVRDLMDFKIFVQVDPDICLLRRVQRDINERGRKIDGIAQQYLSTVKPMYEKYIRNYVDYADLIVAGGGENARISDILAFYINAGQVTPSQVRAGDGE